MRCICFQLLSNCSHPDNRIIADSTYTACYYNTLDINTDDGNHILFWGTPHYSQRGTFHHPVASLRTSRKRVHDMNQNPVPSACFGKLSKWNLCDNNEASQSSGIAVFTRLLGIFRGIRSRHHKPPLQMKRALHIAACVAAYARLVFYVAIGWSSLPFSG